MLEAAGWVITAGIKLVMSNDNAPARNNSNETNGPEWVPEGPSILTSLWLLTVLPHGTKLHMEEHGFSHDLPDTNWIPLQYTKRRWNRDGLTKLKNLVKAIQTSILICPPNPMESDKYDLLVAKHDYNNQPSINKHYLGAREGLYKLASTYGYTINLEEFRKKQAQDSMMITSKKKKDKKDENYIARKAITRSIHLIDRAMTEKIADTQLGELAQKVRMNWKEGNFNSIAMYMEDARVKVLKDLNSKECPCKNELQIIYGMINTKIDEFDGFTKECAQHKFIRSASEPPRPAAAPPVSSSAPPKLSLSNPRPIETPPALPSATGSPESGSSMPGLTAPAPESPSTLLRADDD